MRISAIFALILFSLTSAGCDRTERDWGLAHQANTIDDYKKFLAAHPKGAHVQDATNAIEALDWTSAEAKGTIDGYENYLTMHAGAAHSDAAKNRIESLDWDQTRSDGNTGFSGYVDFHRKYPNSTLLTLVTADIECSQNLSISLGGYGLSGTFSLSSLNVDVSGHRELSGEYQADESGARSLIERYKTLGGTIGKLRQAHLLVADIKGKPRIVALDGSN